MAFVNEKLTEKDKEFIASFKFHAPLWKEKLANIPIKLAADRENGYYLVCLGGQGYTFNEEHPPYYYKLIIDNAIIEIEARFESNGDYNAGIKIIWRIQKIVVSNLLKNISEKQVWSIISNAFTSYGNIHENGHVISTEFQEMVMPYYLNSTNEGIR